MTLLARYTYTCNIYIRCSTTLVYRYIYSWSSRYIMFAYNPHLQLRYYSDTSAYTYTYTLIPLQHPCSRRVSCLSYSTHTSTFLYTSLKLFSHTTLKVQNIPSTLYTGTSPAQLLSSQAFTHNLLLLPYLTLHIYIT